MKPSKNFWLYVAVFVCGIFMLNWVSMYLFSYPFAYCLGKPLGMAVYNGWAQGVFSLASIIFIILLFMGKFYLCFNLAVIMVLIGALPDFAYTAFSLGGTCHG